MEELMQYVWRFRLWPDPHMTTRDGRRVDIIHPGTLNTDSGPDFFNASVRIDGQMWAGNIEIHVHASDWHRHGHDDDPAYDNVILHVVQYDDCDIQRRTDGAVIPQVVMTCAADFRQRFLDTFSSPSTELPCARHLDEIPPLMLTAWLSRLALERLQRKADDIAAILADTHDDWNAATYQTLARGLGFGNNADAMQQLARMVPLKFLMQHGDSIEGTEGLLLGTAGLLDMEYPHDDYEALLVNEYRFYCHKFQLHHATQPQWKTRQRPHNSPVRRVAMLAAMVRGDFSFAGIIARMTQLTDVQFLFDYRLSDYWRTHITLGVPCPPTTTLMSKATLNLLTTNVVAPLLYAHGDRTGNDRQQQLAIEILENTRPEVNRHTEPFTRAGLKCPDAFTSQAFVQLRKEYCQKSKCLYCHLGHRLLSSRVKP